MKVEGRNFSSRKYVLSYDDVMNAQREIIYGQRREVLDGNDMHEYVVSMMNDVCELVVDTYRQELEDNNDSDLPGFINEVKTTFNIGELESLKSDKIKADNVLKELKEKVSNAYKAKEAEIGDDLRNVERFVILKVVDNKWMDHIDAMDNLKNGIGLRAYGQKDPVVQYRIEGGNMFEEMVNSIKIDVTKLLLHLVKREGPLTRENNVRITNEGFDSKAMEAGAAAPNNSASDTKPQPIVNQGPKVGRNDPCPCGSGKKYKNCCGKEA
jgi:preprotein translocase subunit SecA